ncbi:hypothetical protein [Pectinatus haikarae]|nr:hypothetical protein [Pectinatus haikarae]
MKITKVMHQTNKWLAKEPSIFEKALQVVLMIVVATVLMGAVMK